MGYKYEINGHVVEFEQEPTDEDIDEIASSVSSSKEEKTSDKETRNLTDIMSSSKKVGKTGDKLIDAGIYAQKEIVGPLAQGANTAFFGLPKYIANKVNPEFAKQMFPEQSTAQGKFARFNAEVPAYLFGGASKLAQKSMGLFKGTGFAKDVLRGAVGGAVGGGTQIMNPNSKNLASDQATQALVGGASGAVLSSAFGLAKRGKDLYKQYKKVPELREHISNVKEEISSLEKNMSGVGQRESENLTRLSNLEKTAIQEASNRQSVVLQDRVSNLKNTLTVKSKESAKSFKGELLRFFRENSEGYGKDIDTMSDGFIKSGQSMSRQEARAMIEQSISEINEMDDTLLSGEAGGRVREFYNKYSVQQSLGDDVPINFKQFIKDFKDVRNSIRSSVQQGNTRFSSDEAAVAIFNKNLGDKIKDRLPEYKNLQDMYGPIIEDMKYANKIFKPRKGDYDKSARELIEKFGLGQSSLEEQQLIESLKQGTKFSKGVGISDEIVNLGREIVEAENSIKPILESISNKSAIYRDKADPKLLRRIEQLTKRKEFIQADSIEKYNSFKVLLEDRLKEMNYNEQQIKMILSKKENFDNVMKTIGIVSLVGGGLYGLNNLGKAISGQRQ